MRELPFSPVTIRTDVALTDVLYLQEHQTEFPGVDVERIYLRKYPYHSIGAHLFGTLGEVDREAAEEPATTAWSSGDRVGQAGIEYEYDRYLRGRNGASRIQVDAMGRPKGELSVRRPSPGKRLRLSIDLDVQKAGQAALERHGKPGGVRGDGPAQRRGAGAGEQPQLRPQRVRQGRQGSVYKKLTDPDNGAPLAEPRDPGPLSDGVDVQADHRDGGAAGRPDHPVHASCSTAGR